MKLYASDTLHVSSVKAENLLPGEEFEVSDADGEQLIKRGLASKSAPANKMAPAPANKAAKGSAK